VALFFKFRKGESLLRKLFFIQLGILALAFTVILMVLYLSSQARLAKSITALRNRIQPILSSKQDAWRAWQMLGLKDALKTEIKEFTGKFSEVSIDFVTPAAAGPDSDMEILFPSDRKGDLLLRARIDKTRLGAEPLINRETTGLFALLILLFLLLVFASTNFIRRHIYQPLRRINDWLQAVQAGQPFDVGSISAVGEVEAFLRTVDSLYQQAKLAEKQNATAELAAQVAHDIRSPLMALNMVLETKAGPSEQRRVLIREATRRINDIANNLIQQHVGLAEEKREEKRKTPTAPQVDPLQSSLLASLIDVIVSEKRYQFKDRSGVNIFFNCDSTTYGIFAAVQPVEFKRVLSNLINNAVEAIESAGTVEVLLSAAGHDVNVGVRDSGKGIPQEILPLLMQRGVSHGKILGSGLGLHHARSRVEKWGGVLAIESELNLGTFIMIRLPKSPPPGWYVPELILSPETTVVVLDDDSSIHAVWRERFKAEEFSSLRVEYFSSENGFGRWVQRRATQNMVCLIDYELLSSPHNGIEIIQKLGIHNESILVTSRHDEAGVLASCTDFGLRILPKAMAAFVPLRNETLADDFDHESRERIG
jgi:signal transduction histidine kinase